jgi:hypothetical protein
MTPLLLLLLAAHGHPKHARTMKPQTPSSNAAIEKALEGHEAEVQHCYSYASTGKALSGKAALSFFVSAEGNVSQMRLDPHASTLRDISLVECLEDKLSGWTFPGMSKGQQVTHTWAFGAGAAAPAKPSAKSASSTSKHRKHRR